MSAFPDSAYLKHMPRFGLTAPRVACLVAVSLAAAAFEGFGMAMFLPLLDYIQKGREAVLLAARDQGMWKYVLGVFDTLGLPLDLSWMLLALFLLMLLRVASAYARSVYSAWLSQDILHRTRISLYDAYSEADYDLFDSLSTGHIVNLVQTETQRLGSYFGGLFNLISISVLMCGYMAVLLWLSASMTLVALVLLGLGGGVVAWFIRSTRKLSHRTTTSNKDFSFILVERLTGIRLLKLTAVGRREADRLADASARVRDNNFGLSLLNARVDLILEPVVLLAALGILYFAVTAFGMDLARIGLFMLVLLRLLPQAKEFMRTRQNVQANVGSIHAVHMGLEQALARREPQGGGDAALAPLTRGIELKGVRFTYPGADRPALDGLDLIFEAGRTTALVGPSGAGKSTLIDLLPLLRRPQQGAVRYDGRDSRDHDLSSLRRGIAFVSQDAFVLNDTVRSNVAFARPDAGLDEVREALRRAKALEFVEDMPQGLDTVLGERGVRLSGGQRQRLSLARALLQDAPVLILDEPTSALDSESEQEVQAAIRDIRDLGTRTVIIIAHRLSTIRDSDRIVVLADGRVVEQGTHAELVVSEEWYAKVSGIQGGPGATSGGTGGQGNAPS